MSVFEDRLVGIRNLLESRGCVIIEDQPLANGHGHQVKTFRNGSKGPVVSLFHSGKHTVTGKQMEDIKPEIGRLLNGEQATASLNRKVFVVYGHDRSARDQLEILLRRWQLEPLILEDLPSEGQTLIEKLEKYQNEVTYAVVLVTPDDVGNPRGRDDVKALRARQNVVLELGMMLAKVGRKRVAILIPSSTELEMPMENPSDINGLVYIPYLNSVQDAALLLFREMTTQGFGIDPTKI